jgi:ABC-type glycerol-3-phosphate transport system substrate-binding protein
MRVPSFTRRQLLRIVGLGSAAAVAASCKPEVVVETVIKEVERIVKETVVVEGTPQVVEKIVKETVLVEKEQEPVKSEPITIRYRYYWADTTFLGGLQQEHIAKYDYKVPGTDITIDLELGIQFDRTMADLAAGTAPDVFWAQYSTGGMPQGIEEGLFACAHDYAEADGFDFDDILDSLRQIYLPEVYGGKMWAVPYEQASFLWIANLELFDAAGIDPKKEWTWEDLVSQGTRLTQDVGGLHPDEEGFVADDTDIWGVLPRFNGWPAGGYLPYSAGSAYVDATGSQATIDNPALLETLTWMRDLYQTHRIAPLSTVERGFYSGKVAVAEVGNWELVDLWREMPGSECIYTPVHPTVGRTATHSFDKELWILSQEDKAVEQAAYTFASWFGFEEYLDYAIDTGYIPFLKSHLADPQWASAVEAVPLLQTAMEMTAYVTPPFWSLFRGASEAEAAMRELWSAVTQTDTPIEPLLATTNAEVQRVLEKYA